MAFKNLVFELTFFTEVEAAAWERESPERRS
jgi:hypothetical protein